MKIKDLFNACLENRIPFTKYKNYCFQIGSGTSKIPYNYFRFNVDLTSRLKDHHGFEAELEIMEYFILFQIYDSRHADHIPGYYEVCNDQLSEDEMTDLEIVEDGLKVCGSCGNYTTLKCCNHYEEIKKAHEKLTRFKNLF